MTQNWDRLNLLRRFEEYYAPMGIPDERKRERAELAVDLDLIILLILSMMAAEVASGEGIDEDYYSGILSDRVSGAVEEAVGSSVPGIAERAAEIVGATARMAKRAIDALPEPGSPTRSELARISEGWAFSRERAAMDAENEANWAFNAREQGEAMESGRTLKTWATMGDERVRPTHMEVGMETLPIDEPFMVGGYPMMFPMDASMGAPPEEIANCRCWLEYS